ncbi:tumor necrosis factor receptor superfamily member 16 [Prionailurus bengalensis]|uniref:tumor necrosis factor receptor superfamily member 16 n=1 Tax=Prionailurus bengalensis TaxID=37029 RepID=UPI001CA950B7|nr:tumor necrosis factor receptor superfamily member 16 [Prionailurus bengalensis]
MGAGAAGCAMDGPRPLLLLLPLLLGVSLGGAKEACPTGLFTHSGECCKACNLGEGVAQPCGANQTVCEPCLDSVTFSDVVSATEPCKPCTECVGLQSMSAPCVEADDAVCRCAYGYYQDETTGRCEACRVCEAGSGLVFSCQDRQNTVCEECPDGTYSDEANHVDPCLPCTVCEDTERQLRECTRWADAECEEIPGRWITRSTPSEGSDSTAPSTEEPEVPPEQDLIASTVADVVTTVMGSSQPVVTRGTADNLIPVYCSILAAVVVGLVAYIAFKRWNSCQQDKQGANSRPVNQTPPPEGEKLHSDSGISVDSQSLHDQQSHTQTAAGQALKGDGGLYSSLPSAKREEVEKLLNGSAGDTWRHLAGELGYQPEHIDSFTREACPARALLASWAAQDSATLDALLAALRRIQRADIVESLCSESTATSPV